jgi:ribosomal protein L7Ae-like RNA K-turn-binding protein
MNDRILNMLGLIVKANKLVNGEERTLEATRNNNAKVIFLASDAGRSTAKRVSDKARYYNVPLIDKYNKNELSAATGSENRVVLAVTDKGFANKCIDLLEKGK